jgi:hypothetical protein
VDQDAPMVFINLAPAQPDGANGWYKGPVTPLATAIDESDVVELRCALDPAAVPVKYDDLPATLCPYLEGKQAVSADGQHKLYAAAMDPYGNKSEVVSAGFKIDATAPVITCPAGGPFSSGSGSHTVGPAGVDASVSGLDPAASHLTGVVQTDMAGPQTVTFSATDLAGNQASKTCAYQVYQFTGFYPPVKGTPALNATKAGGALPVKFSLSADLGLAILAAGSPTSQLVDCQTLAPAGAASPAVSAGKSGLQYDPDSGMYTYVWKTEKGWAASCRAFTLKLWDGGQHVAYFQFK